MTGRSQAVVWEQRTDRKGLQTIKERPKGTTRNSKERHRVQMGKSAYGDGPASPANCSPPSAPKPRVGPRISP